MPTLVESLAVNSSASTAVVPASAGAVFQQVSCPHYLAEIMIYLGLLALTQVRPIVALIALWVVSGAPCEHTLAP